MGLQSLVDLKLLEKVVEIILNYSENTKWEIIKQSPELWSSGQAIRKTTTVVGGKQK